MSVVPVPRDLVMGVSPCALPQARLVAAACRAGATGVLDLGGGDRWARQQLELAAAWAPGGFGVRVTAGCTVRPDDLPAAVDTVLLGRDAPWCVAELAGTHRVLVEVTGPGEARAAAAAGAYGLVARGNEAGGPVGELTSFVLLQRLLADDACDLPVWVAGGIGPRSAAACVLGGAAGVVLDSQLGLVAEAELPAGLAAAIRSMDGSETVLVDGYRSLRGRPGVPVGQDGFLAATFADAYGDAATAVRAVRRAITDAVADDGPSHLLGAGAAAGLLGAGSAMAGSLGTALPVVQGPMTRVSDQAPFAEAVAAAGALPFIALALSDAERSRAVLVRTRDALGERPWGVGVLGFAPEEIRAAQLAVIAEIRPSHAIVAGGRPAQARALEAAGIKTFLHVPSPGLLRQFLAAGARRFVFEGTECGGHVGPRGSFPLWEAQLGVLAGQPDVDGVEVLFAGGVHDARSAAMVAVLAAPLAARGVRVGVLMGTAYLFTEEAVACGAIRPAFQRQVLAAERTALLETAPGHATRGVASPFTETFAGRKADLESAGLPRQEVWERLEQLNVGRLRIASKGLHRRGAELVPVDEAGQVADGLFMAGQVAVLRSAVTTVAALHAEVTTGAVEFLAARTSQLRDLRPAPAAAPAAPAPLDIAIVGMACVFPKSPDLAAFWATILGGTDAVTEVPPDRWDPDTYYAPDGGPGRTPSKWGGFLDPVPFDPLRYGIPPTALRSIEPSQLLALEVARRALEDAGAVGGDHARTAVVFGAEAGSDLSNAGVLRTLLPAYLGELPPEMDAHLPAFTEDSFPGVLANVIAGRIANRLDLGGSNYTVDAACASSLAAVDVACQQLTAGTADLVLCGGVDLHNGINDYLLFASVHALSPTGRSRTFDAAADGIALGEGAACVVLKRLADARRDGDRIYAVVKGVGGGSDGKALGLTAPRPDGQRRALDRAYRNARISPAKVGLVEAHGTGTAVGDRTELATLTALFTEAGAAPGGCALGSVKSQIGHTKCAAGLAGLIKAAMALYAGVRPPTINLDRPNPAWDPAASPFAFDTAARPWAAPPAERVAGVSAFGFGGTNFHVVLQGDGAQEPDHGPDEWPAELFAFRGPTAIAQLRDLVAANDAAGRPWRLRDLARTASRWSDGRDEPVRVAVVADSLDNLDALLARALAGEHDPAVGLFQPGTAPLGGQIAFLFPGQGSQRPGMLAELFVAFPEVRHYLRLGRRWASTLFPPASFDAAEAEARAGRIRDTRVAQPVLGIAGLAAGHVLRRLGVRPDLVGGHSYGELVALCVAGAFEAGTLLDLSEARAEAILAAAGDEPGTMAAVSASRDEVVRVLAEAGLAGEVVPANHNAPRQTVVSGPTAAVERAVAAFRAAGLSGKRIPVACAFHSPVVAGAGPAFGRVLSGRAVRALEVPVWSNRTAAAYGGTAREIRAELSAQVGAPVRFVDQIESMYAAGARVFVEAGPGAVLTGLVGAILGDRPHLAVPCDGGSRGDGGLRGDGGSRGGGRSRGDGGSRGGGGLRGFLGAVARLAVGGLPVRTGWLYAGRDARDVTGTTPPPPPGWTVDGHLVRTRDGACLPGGLAPARRVQEKPMTPPTAPDPDALLTEFLRTSREMVAAQRDVLLAYLGAAPVVPPSPSPVPALPAAPALSAPAVSAPALSAPAVSAPAVSAAPVPVAAAPPPGPGEVMDAVLGIISERTGYPVDLIEPDLDLEADLSVDSIKRTEIAGELAARLGAGRDAARLDDAELEDLAKARTARAITDWLIARLAGADAGEDAPPSPRGLPSTAEPVAADAPSSAGVAPKRMVVRRIAVTAEPGPADALAGTTFVVVGGPDGVAGEVRTQLTEHGASVLDGSTPGERVDGVVHLGGLDGGDEPVLPGAFAEYQALLREPPRWLVAGYHDGERAAGLAGLFRTVDREYPGTVARAVAVDSSAPAAGVARSLLAEVLATDDGRLPVVARAGGVRYRYAPVEVGLGTVGTSGAGPAGDGAAEAAAIGLDRDSVVVLVGGARGITAHCAAALAAASRCRIELIGRTPAPTGTAAPAGTAAPPGTAAPAGTAQPEAMDPAGLRAALIARGMRSPAEIEREVAAILAGREVAATVAELTGLGSRVRYHAADVRDADAVRRLFKEIHAEHGRLDGAVFAAGVIADRLVAEKDPDGFRRVYDTKVGGALAVLGAVEELPADPGRFVVLFGSIAAVLGNRGQADYAAANDAMDTIGARWGDRTGTRCLTVHWGPWAPGPGHGGMVTPELSREYARRGIALIDPEEGALSLLRELAWGDPAVRSVVYTASGW